MEDVWYGMEMEWKKIASMEYGKIIFHSIPCPARKSTRRRPGKTFLLVLVRFLFIKPYSLTVGLQYFVLLVTVGD